MHIDKSTLCLPQAVSDWIGNAPLTDTSGHSGDKTYYVDRTPPAYLKISPKGKFARAAMMQRYWASKGLSADVLLYLSDDRDYIAVAPVPGKDGLAPEHLSEPETLSRVFGASLRKLHDTPFDDCPVDLLPLLLDEAKTRAFQQWHMDDLRPFIGAASAETAREEIAANAHLLRRDALVHGDYCLPNIMLDNWQLTGFIDVADSGMGDRHYDIAWGLWTLMYNLKDAKYGEMFLDAYGRDKINPARLRICALLASME